MEELAYWELGIYLFWLGLGVFAESRKKFYFYLERSSQGDRVLILAFQTGCSWVAIDTSHVLDKISLVRPCPCPKEWMSSDTETGRSKEEAVGWDLAPLLASGRVSTYSEGSTSCCQGPTKLAQFFWPSPWDKTTVPRGLPHRRGRFPDPQYQSLSPHQSRSWGTCPGLASEALTTLSTLAAIWELLSLVFKVELEGPVGLLCGFLQDLSESCKSHW